MKTKALLLVGLCAIVLMTLSFLVGCQKKVKLCTMTTPSLSENQWNMYYPITKTSK